MTPTASRGFPAELALNAAAAARKIALFCFVVALVTAVYSLVVEERYTCYALLMVPSGGETGGVAALAGGLAGGAVGGLGVNLTDLMGKPSSPNLDLAYQVLTSRFVFEQLIERHDLMSRLGVTDMEHAVEKMVQRTNVTLTPEGFFTLSIQGWSAEGTARLAGDLIDISNERLGVLVTSMTRKARIEAESSLVRAEDSLHAATAALEEFRASTGIILPEAQATEAVSVLAEVEKLLIQARAELAGVTVSMAPGSPVALSLARQTDYLEGALALRLAQGDSLSVLPGMARTPELLRRYEELFMDVETRRAVYLLLRQKYEQLVLDEARESPILEVLVHPVPPLKRSHPKRKNMVIKNTILAFLVAMSWMVLVTYFRRLNADERKAGLIREVREELLRQLYPFRRG